MTIRAVPSLFGRVPLGGYLTVDFGPTPSVTRGMHWPPALRTFPPTHSLFIFAHRHSMEQLWRSLKQANPELLTDFEEFVAEVASEVEGAQRALE